MADDAARHISPAKRSDGRSRQVQHVVGLTDRLRIEAQRALSGGHPVPAGARIGPVERSMLSAAILRAWVSGRQGFGVYHRSQGIISPLISARPRWS